MLHQYHQLKLHWLHSKFLSTEPIWDMITKVTSMQMIEYYRLWLVMIDMQLGQQADCNVTDLPKAFAKTLIK